MRMIYTLCMETKSPGVGVDILIIKNNRMLLGLLSDKWMVDGVQVYGVPGRGIRFGENIGDTVKRDVLDDIGCHVISHNIFSVNASYTADTHYINIGVTADIQGEPKNLHSEDWDSWEWFDISSLPTNLFPSAKNAIECYLNKSVCVSQ